MNLWDPDLDLLGDAKGRIWNGRKAVQDGFFRKWCLRVFARELGREKKLGEVKTAGCCNVSNIAADGKH